MLIAWLPVSGCLYIEMHLLWFSTTRDVLLMDNIDSRHSFALTEQSRSEYSKHSPLEDFALPELTHLICDLVDELEELSND